MIVLPGGGTSGGHQRQPPIIAQHPPANDAFLPRSRRSSLASPLALVLLSCLLFFTGPTGAQTQTFATASNTAQFLQALGAALRGARDGSTGGSRPGATTAPAATIAVVGNLTLGSTTSFSSVPGRLPSTTRYNLQIRGTLSDSPAPPPLLDTSRRSGLVVPTGPSQSLLLSTLTILNG